MDILALCLYVISGLLTAKLASIIWKYEVAECYMVFLLWPLFLIGLLVKD